MPSNQGPMNTVLFTSNVHGGVTACGFRFGKVRIREDRYEVRGSGRRNLSSSEFTMCNSNKTRWETMLREDRRWPRKVVQQEQVP